MNKRIISIDPSMHSTGIAYFMDDKLVKTSLIKVKNKTTEYEACKEMTLRIVEDISICPDVLVIEEQANRGKTEKMSMRSYTFLASLTYMIAYSLHAKQTFFYQPVQWKHTIEKKPHHNRIYNTEMVLGSYVNLLRERQSDIMDAIGLGRYHLGKVKS